MFIRKNISVYKRSDIIFCQQGLNVGKIRRYAAPWLSGGSTFSPKDLSMMFDEAKNLCCEVRIEPSVKNECSTYTSSYTIISIFAWQLYCCRAFLRSQRDFMNRCLFVRERQMSKIYPCSAVFFICSYLCEIFLYLALLARVWCSSPKI